MLRLSTKCIYEYMLHIIFHQSLTYPFTHTLQFTTKIQNSKFKCSMRTTKNEIPK